MGAQPTPQTLFNVGIEAARTRLRLSHSPVMSGRSVI